MNRYELETSVLHTIMVNTSQAGMKVVGLQQGFSKFDPLSDYTGYEGNRRIIIVQEQKKPDQSGRRMVDIYRMEETKKSDALFPDGDLQKDLSSIYSGVLSASRIFDLISEETAQTIAPTVVQFALRGKSLLPEQPLLATVRRGRRATQYDEGLMGMANRMQTTIDEYFDNNFNLVLRDEADPTNEYVFPVDTIGSGENIQVPVKSPRVSKTPRPQEQQGTSLSFEQDSIVVFDTGFVGSWAREDKYPKFAHSTGLVFELGDGDNGQTAYLAALGSDRTLPAGHVWARVMNGITDRDVNAQDPHRYASGGLLSPIGIVNRAETLAIPFAVTMANSKYMVARREQRRALLNR